MPSTYSNLKIQLMATGENNTTWGDVTNVNLGTALEEAIVGSADVAFSNAHVTLTLTDSNVSQTARNMRLNLTGNATSGYNLIVPAIEKPYIVNNGTDGTITVKNATGTGVAVPSGKTMWVYNDGTNVTSPVSYLSTLALGAALGVSSGGTGAATLTGYVKGNGTSAMTASATIPTTDISSGKALARIDDTNVTLTLGGTPTTALLQDVSMTLGWTGQLAVSRGGTGAATLTGYVKGNGTSAMTASATVPTSDLSGTVAVANGGTALSSTPTNGQLLIGNGTNYTLATLTAGSGISITNGAGSISIAASGLALTNWTEGVNTSSPNATIPVVYFNATNAATNVDAAIVPKGAGAFSLAVADNSTTGGDKRGIYASDLQSHRTVSTQVASGAYSFVTGSRNTASSSYSAALGGANNTASGSYSAVVGGDYGTTRGARGLAHGGSPISTTSGGSQFRKIILGRQTTNATATVLAADTATAGGSNQVNLPNNSAFYFKGSVIANVTGGGDTKGWTIEGVIKRGASAAATSIVGTATVTSNYADAGASTWAVTATADTTNGCLAITVTGQASTTIRWVASIETTEVTF